MFIFSLSFKKKYVKELITSYLYKPKFKILLNGFNLNLTSQKHILLF